MWLFVCIAVCGQSDARQGRVLEGSSVCFCVGGMTGRRGAREEHVEVPWTQVYLITGAKSQSRGSKADRDYWCTTQDSDGTRDRKVRLSRNRGVGAAIVDSLCLSLSETVPSLVSAFFQCILALDFCSLMTTACLGLAWNCSVPSFSSLYSSTA